MVHTGNPKVRALRLCLECEAKAAIDYRCLRHHKRWRRWPPELREPLPTPCAAIGCTAPIADSEMCAKHINAWKRKCAAARVRQQNYDTLLEDHLAVEALPMATQRCEMRGCEGLPFKSGLCQRHYDSWLQAPEEMRCAVPLCTQLRRKRGVLCGQHETERKQIASQSPSGACSLDGCLKPAATRGYCEAHYRRWLRNGDPTVDRRRRPGLSDPTPMSLLRSSGQIQRAPATAQLCIAPRCTKPVMAGNLCAKHIRRRKQGRGSAPERLETGPGHEPGADSG